MTCNNWNYGKPNTRMSLIDAETSLSFGFSHYEEKKYDVNFVSQGEFSWL